ncbi:hypothetical protein [Methylotenera sp.]|uniref:hypothetical protein n=1 Tax=Methylotenera sp. TaxID=2051956 RepID=UPI00248A2718|nr:hypothetical protein [Methylotenera sp.]MDI1361764.1 hypothetical protein [Methylotenera sp.]
MKSQFKNTPIALAVAALFLSPVAFADNNNDGRDRDRDPVSIKKDISVKQEVEQKGRVNVTGQIYIDSSSMAVVNDAQVTTHNQVDNNLVTNDAKVNGNALNAAKGNIGVNVSSGDNNQQANAAALSAADASFVFGSSDAEVFANQSASGNHTTNLANTNAATLGGNALANASGNIGVNISAGNSNQQKNDLAASVAVARMATATVQANQSNGYNTTSNSPVQTETTEYRQVSLALNATGGYIGGGVGGYYGSASGTSAGTSDQIGNVYPDIWSGTPQNTGPGDHVVHPGGVAVGHFDLDTQTQGGSDLNNDGGALAFGNKGTYSGSEHGTLGFVEAGVQSLSGTVTGMVPVVVAVNVATTNTSFLGDNALQNASGNIGVNIASGTNNQQFNGLAMSATQAGTGTGGGSGGE